MQKIGTAIYNAAIMTMAQELWEGLARRVHSIEMVADDGEEMEVSFVMDSETVH